MSPNDFGQKETIKKPMQLVGTFIELSDLKVDLVITYFKWNFHTLAVTPWSINIIEFFITVIENF